MCRQFEHEARIQIKRGRPNFGMLTGAMRRLPIGLAVLTLSMAGGFGAGAQEGHPLTGTWAGEWEVGAERRTRVTLVMNWDGTAVTGVINPGPEPIPLTRVTPDWSRWTVRIEAETPASAATPVRVEAEGRLEDIGSSHRRIVGTWTQNGTTGRLTLTRE